VGCLIKHTVNQQKTHHKGVLTNKKPIQAKRHKGWKKEDQHIQGFEISTMQKNEKIHGMSPAGNHP